MTYIDYIEYFKNLSVQHPEMCHEDKKGKEIFMLKTWEDNLGEYRSTIQEKSYLFTLLDPTITQEHSRLNDECCVIFEGAFIISHYHSDRKEGIDSFVSAKEKSYQVLKQIENRMFEDARTDQGVFNGCKITYCDELVRSISPMDCIGDTNYSGWMMVFQIKITDLNIGCHAPETGWKDGWEASA